MEDNTGLTFNSMLANLYRDGHDSLAWHSDDETSLGPEPTIASISFGDMRTFQLRKKPPKVWTNKNWLHKWSKTGYTSGQKSLNISNKLHKIVRHE